MTNQTFKIIQEFRTPLGVIFCGVNFCQPFSIIDKKEYENGISEIIKTESHLIEIISFKIRLPLYNGQTITDSQGWIFRIEKTKNLNDKLEIFCKLEENNKNIEFDITTGENLEAISAENSEWILHIGTEDGEILNSRAENGDWFPPRLSNTVNFYKSITEMKKNGFITKIPDLKMGEKLHLQYLTAYDKNDVKNGNTWLAVDEFKLKLENWIGVS